MLWLMPKTLGFYVVSVVCRQMWQHWPLVVMAGAPRRRFMGIWEAMASRLCWKACCIRRCCSSAKRAIFLSGPSPTPVSSFSLSCSSVAALAKPATCCWPRANAIEGLAAMMGGVRSSGIREEWYIHLVNSNWIYTDWKKHFGIYTGWMWMIVCLSPVSGCTLPFALWDGAVRLQCWTG